MKKSIYDQSEPRDNMMMAALKQVVSNLKATNSMTGQTGSIAKTKQIGSSTKTEANPLRLAQQEKLFSSANATPILGGIQKTDAEIAASKLPSDFPASQWEKMKPREQQRLLSKTNLTPQEQWSLLGIDPKHMNNLVGQVLASNSYANTIGAMRAKNADFSGSDAETLKNEQNALRKWNNALSNRGANAFKSADAKTMHEEQNTLKKVNEGNQALNDLLTSINLDMNNMSGEQKNIVSAARISIANNILLGNYNVEDIVYYAAYAIATRTTPPQGTNYIVPIARAGADEPHRKMFPPIGSIKTDSLSEDDSELISESDKYYLPDGSIRNNYSEMMLYKNKVYQKWIDKYNEELSTGKTKIGDYQKYYDQAMLEFFENYVKPIYFRKDKNGNGIGESIPIGELVPPEDQSFGAQVARAAIRLVGLGYNEEAGQGYYDEMQIDCSGLVKWAVTEVDQYLGVYGVTQKAKYQITTKEEPVWTEGNIKLNLKELKPGDTLFWRGKETGEIKHTAIYIGNGLMIEAQNGSVQIVGVREETKGGDEEDSTLVQINRMTEDELLKKAERNEKLHG